jgi:hypothetical protein
MRVIAVTGSWWPSGTSGARAKTPVLGQPSPEQDDENLTLNRPWQLHQVTPPAIREPPPAPERQIFTECRWQLRADRVRSMRHSDTLNEQLQTALNSRVLIEQAKGKLTERGYRGLAVRLRYESGCFGPPALPPGSQAADRSAAAPGFFLAPGLV